ncbi:hypothetical protein ANO11243_091500 [Dothideomycetidae sp. 11243]|nr:hypothetical protein ANO11243_091500 [fungal sp. No.11243]
MSRSDPIRIAIVGGGLAGLALANALIRTPPDAASDHPDFEVHVFEGKPAFSEREFSVRLATNARKALRYCFPNLNEMLERAGGHHFLGMKTVIEEENAKLKDKKQIEEKHDMMPLSVFRTTLLDEFVTMFKECGDKAKLYTGMDLVSISTGDSVVLTFGNGKTETFDAVIGADGYRSVVRRFVLGDKAAEEPATAAGFWDCRALVPAEAAQKLLFKPVKDALRYHQKQNGTEQTEQSSEYNDDSENRQWIYCGDTSFVMSGMFGDKGKAAIVVSALETEPWKTQKQVLTRKWMEEEMRGWVGDPFLKPVLDALFYETDEVQGYRHYHFKKTSTYNNGRMCIIGDAAHAMTPWQGAGAGIAFEDAMVLSHLLWNCPSRKHLDAAFETFTEVRKDRCQYMIDSSETMGKLYCGQIPEAGERNPDTGFFDLDPVRCMDVIRATRTEAFNLNHEDHRQDAKMKLEKMIRDRGL